MRFLCQAYAFTRRHLYTQAAEVYEDALKTSPQSVNLRIAALFAQRRAGHVARAEYHRSRLPRGTIVPGDQGAMTPVRASGVPSSWKAAQ